MVPVVIHKKLVHCFNFYLNGSIRQGMRYEQALYGLIYEFAERDRLRMYQLACELAEQEIPIVVTTDGSQYSIWVNLQSPAYSTLQVPSQDLIQAAGFEVFHQDLPQPSQSQLSQARPSQPQPSQLLS